MPFFTTGCEFAFLPQFREHYLEQHEAKRALHEQVVGDIVPA
jgi:hypothetical protein